MDDEKSIALTRWIRAMGKAEFDSLAPYRDRIMLSMGTATSIVMLPFTANNFVQERFFVAWVLVVVQVVVLINTRALWQKRPAPVPYAWLLLPYLLGITVAVASQGVPGVLWAYPVVLFCYFVLNRRLAFWYSIVVLLHVTAITQHFISDQLALRLFGTLLLTIIMTNIVLNVISELHRRLAGQALTDPLTGLYNRRFMTEILGGLIGRAKRTQVTAAALMIDVDHFKRVNDELGHDHGDRVLCEITALIAMRLRAHDWLFRWGGEEFVVLLEDTDAAGADRLAEDIRRSVEAAPIIAGRDVTVSIGIAPYRNGQTADEWLHEADEALYRAKESGRNCVVGG